MFKTNIKKLIQKFTIVAAMVTTISVFNTAINQTPRIHADAATVQADGPWEIGHGSDGNNYEALQAVHNGNEIYYSIAPNDKNTALFQQSAANWNALGVIKLVQVNWGDPNSEITMQSSDETPGNSTIDTNGTTQRNGMLQNNKEIMASTKIIIYNNINNKSQSAKQTVFDHELGHALGFAHDNRKLHNGKYYKKYHLTMNAYNSNKTYKLGGIEQRTLADHYEIQPSNGYLNTNC